MQYYICLTCCQIPLLFSDNYYTLLYLSRLSIIYRESDLLAVIAVNTIQSRYYWILNKQVTVREEEKMLTYLNIRTFLKKPI